METEHNNLNDDWINNFEKTDKLYQDFYKDDLYYTNLQIIYVNRDNEIEKMKQETILMCKPNYISKEEMFEILKNHLNDNERRYRLLSILKYNITLEPDDVAGFMKSDNNDNFLTVIKNIDAVPFEKTINMLHDLNDIIFIFYEKSNELKKPNANNITHKVRVQISTTKKKTYKKQYKD